MEYFIKEDGSYYEGDQIDPSDLAVVQRPGPDYTWENDAWIIDIVKQKKRIIDLMQVHMDEKAVVYGYDHILSAVSYSDSTVEEWRTEGTAFKAWREAVWSFGLSLLAAIEAGTNTITTEAELLAALPAFPLD